MSYVENAKELLFLWSKIPHHKGKDCPLERGQQDTSLAISLYLSRKLDGMPHALRAGMKTNKAAKQTKADAKAYKDMLRAEKAISRCLDSFYRRKN